MMVARQKRRRRTKKRGQGEDPAQFVQHSTGQPTVGAFEFQGEQLESGAGSELEGRGNSRTELVLGHCRTGQGIVGDGHVHVHLH